MLWVASAGAKALSEEYQTLSEVEEPVEVPVTAGVAKLLGTRLALVLALPPSNARRSCVLEMPVGEPCVTIWSRQDNAIVCDAVSYMTIGYKYEYNTIKERLC